MIELTLCLIVAFAGIAYFVASGAHWSLNLAAIVPLIYAALAFSKIRKRRQESLSDKELKLWPKRENLLEKKQLEIIANRFSVNLPQEYVELLTEDESDYGLLYSARRLSEENELCRTAPVYSDFWDDSWFAIHADGTGNVYFITTDPYDGRIYDYDHEQTFSCYKPLRTPAFASIEGFLDSLYDPR